MNETDELQRQQNEDEARIEQTRMKGPQSLPPGGNRRIVEQQLRDAFERYELLAGLDSEDGNDA